MEPRAQIDATKYSFDDFVSFIFDHDSPPKDESQKWYWKSDVIFSPQQFCTYYIQLFRNSGILLERFSKPQIEGGFWTVISGVDWSVAYLIWETDIPFPHREECVRAMADLFRHFFSREALDTSCHMWWDALCYAWHCGNRARERGGEDLEMQDVMFQTLSTILYFESEDCQAAALHGLGHLHHPDTQTLVEKYIGDHPSTSESLKEYAFAAAKFKIL
jgi:hypothetical protein